MVPREPPSDRQGGVHVQDQGPGGTQAVANGNLLQRGRRMAGALEVGCPGADGVVPRHRDHRQVRSHAYRHAGIRNCNAIITMLFTCRHEPRTGAQYAIRSRATRPISGWPRGSRFRPAAHVSFWVARETEPTGIRVRRGPHPGREPTGRPLEDVNGHSSQDTGASCPFWHQLHPFLTHYQKDNGDGTCSPAGTTGGWWAATGARDGWEQWDVDLSCLAGYTSSRSRSPTPATTSSSAKGLFVDDVEPTGAWGRIVERRRRDPRWTAGRPRGPLRVAASRTRTTGSSGRSADTPLQRWARSPQASFAPAARDPRLPRPDLSGAYPFSARAVWSTTPGVGFALENQTRPVYAVFFTDNTGDIRRPRARPPVVRRQRRGGGVAGHLAERGLRDVRGVAVERARGPAPPRRTSTTSTTGSPWTTRSGRSHRGPGGRDLFDFAVYPAAAMTLHQLRLAVGDPGVLPDPARLAEVPRRQRDDRAVHRPRGEDLRAGPRCAIPDLALHAGEARIRRRRWVLGRPRCPQLDARSAASQLCGRCAAEQEAEEPANSLAGSFVTEGGR